MKPPLALITILLSLVSIESISQTVSLYRSEGYINTHDSVRLYYNIVGSGNDTILVVHGGPYNSNYLLSDIKPLAAHHTLIFYDQRSAGYSSAPLQIIPVLSTNDMERDLQWYEKHTGFRHVFGDNMYTGLQRDNLEIHLQWHHDSEDDPAHPSLIKFFVSDIQTYTDEFVKKGTINKEKLRRNTPWGTHEFGFYDLNKNAIFIVQNARYFT